MASGPRSFDDVDIALSNRNPERLLMHQHSASNLAASGGTLPRLGKGFVQVIIAGIDILKQTHMIIIGTLRSLFEERSMLSEQAAIFLDNRLSEQAKFSQQGRIIF